MQYNRHPRHPRFPCILNPIDIVVRPDQVPQTGCLIESSIQVRVPLVGAQRIAHLEVLRVQIAVCSHPPSGCILWAGQISWWRCHPQGVHTRQQIWKIVVAIGIGYGGADGLYAGARQGYRDPGHPRFTGVLHTVCIPVQPNTIAQPARIVKASILGQVGFPDGQIFRGCDPIGVDAAAARCLWADCIVRRDRHSHLVGRWRQRSKGVKPSRVGSRSRHSCTLHIVEHNLHTRRSDFPRIQHPIPVGIVPNLVAQNSLRIKTHVVGVVVVAVETRCHRDDCLSADQDRI